MNTYLYHITNFNALEYILTQDTLKAGRIHHWKDLQSTGHFRNAVSLTRDLTFSSRYMPTSASVILVLDKDKLASKYKITPVADTANELNPQAGRRVGQSKAEECIYSDIANLHNYLVKILIKNSAQMAESTSDVLKEYNSKYSVPFTLTECLTEADHTQQAIDAFGTTYYKTRAGYMLKDGRLLDLTYGGNPREDHRAIQDAFDDVELDSESDYLIEFMNEGNIRCIPEIPAIDLSVEPTDKQFTALKDYISYWIGHDKHFEVQFSDKNGNQVDWKEYNGFVSAAEIILDIKEYFDGTSLNESYDYTVSDIIGTDTLYHATYKPYWEEIKKSGALRPKAHSTWDISGDFIYLSRDPDNAFSYAETSELVPEEYLDQIVVLEIDANKLNLDLLDCDHNQAYGADEYEVDYEDPQTWEEMQYAGSIPLRAIKKVHDESKAETLNEVYPQKGETKSDFINRFMRAAAREYPNVKQRYAVAYSYWDRRKLKESVRLHKSTAYMLRKDGQISERNNLSTRSEDLNESIQDNTFNINKTGIRDYDEWLSSQAARDRDNVDLEFKYMTPREYFEACGQLFNSSFNSQVRQIENDKNINKELDKVYDSNEKMNLTLLDYVSDPPTQEGRHRMYVLAQKYGWDENKYPVAVFTIADPKRAEKEKEERRQEKLYKYIDKAVTNALDYTYRNYDELKDQISYYLENYIDDPEVKISERGHQLAIIVSGLEYEISQDEFDWDEDKSDPGDDFDIEDLS